MTFSTCLVMTALVLAHISQVSHSTVFPRGRFTKKSLSNNPIGPFVIEYVEQPEITVISRVVSPFKVTAAIKKKPDSQPEKTVLFLLSVIVKNADLSQQMDDVLVSCMSKTTLTEPKSWGLFNANQFATGFIQAEYYVFVGAETSLTFRNTISPYIRGKDLEKCVRSGIPDLRADASIMTGRKVIEPMPNDIVEKNSGVPQWVIAVVLGLVVLIIMLTVILLAFRRKRTFPEEIYDSDRSLEFSEKDIEEQALEDLEAELKAIATRYN